MESASYGDSLPDSETIVNARSESLLGLLPTVSSFISYRASLEREYAKKLSESASKARLQAIKEGAERSGTGNKGTSTLEAGWMKVLESADLDAREHLLLADNLQGKVCEALNSASVRLEGVRKKHHQFASKLLSEKDRSFGEKDKAKQKYFDACDTLESARQKKSQAKDDKQSDKFGKAFDLAMDDMYAAKNHYLLTITTYNSHKTRHYTTDLPSLHNDFQTLESTVLSTLLSYLSLSTSFQRNSLDVLMRNVGVAEEGIKGINGESDMRSFVEAKRGERMGWEVPGDETFEECSVWHDTNEISTTSSSLNFLQNVKIKSLSKLAEMTPLIESKRREVGGLRNLREAYERDRTLGDAGVVMENLLESSRETTLMEIQQNELRSQVDSIDATLGDDAHTSLTLHEFKSSSFVTPATCIVCEGSIWGKGLSCRACGVACHAKCELKVPPGCSKVHGQNHVKSRNSISRSSPVTPTSPSASSCTSPPPSSFNSLSLCPLNAQLTHPPPSATSSPRSSSTFAPPPTRQIPPPISQSFPVPPSSTQALTEKEKGKMMYEYSAQTAFEITVQEDEEITIAEPEDEAGWMKVSTRDGRTGLVPASYISLGGGEGGSAAVQEVEALYDYEAQTVDELSVAVGEKLVLTEVGMDAGDGWAEATKDGRKGLVPSSYVKLV